MDKTVYLTVKGMHCPDCPTKIEKGISKMDGVTQIKVDLETEEGCVKYNSHLTDISDIVNEIREMGFEVENG